MFKKKRLHESNLTFLEENTTTIVHTYSLISEKNVPKHYNVLKSRFQGITYKHLHLKGIL